jgi:hypothetical protein
VLSLNDDVLLRTAYVMPGVSGTGSSYTTAASQIDVRPRDDPPWLFTANVNAEKSSAEGHSFSLWLDDKASNFQAFPRD